MQQGAISFSLEKVWLMSAVANPPKSPAKKRKLRRLAICVAVALPVLYVLSSGPLVYLISTGRTPLVRQVHYEMHEGRAYATSVVGPGPILRAIYAPLVWIGGQSWGTPLQSYWTLFYSDSDEAQ